MYVLNEKVITHLKYKITDDKMLANTIVEQNVPEHIAQEVINVLFLDSDKLGVKWSVPKSDYTRAKHCLEQLVIDLVFSGEIVYRKSMSDFINDILAALSKKMGDSDFGLVLI